MFAKISKKTIVYTIVLLLLFLCSYNPTTMATAYNDTIFSDYHPNGNHIHPSLLFNLQKEELLSTQGNYRGRLF